MALFGKAQKFHATIYITKCVGFKHIPKYLHQQHPNLFLPRYLAIPHLFVGSIHILGKLWPSIQLHYECTIGISKTICQ